MQIAKKNIGKKAANPGWGTESVQIPYVEKPARKAPVYARLTDDKYLEQGEIKALFNVITDIRDRAIFRLSYQRGLRAHEVGLIQLADFREREGSLYVRRGKGSISREYSLLPAELKALRRYLKLRGSEPGPMFPSRQGRGLLNKKHGLRTGVSPERLLQMIKSYCKEAGIPAAKAHTHVLKHSCGTHLAELGATAEAIQFWLGHRDIKSTAQYMHFSNRRRAELNEKLQDWE